MKKVRKPRPLKLKDPRGQMGGELSFTDGLWIGYNGTKEPYPVIEADDLSAGLSEIPRMIAWLQKVEVWAKARRKK